MQQFIGGTAMMAFWYHFAIMFEALFILTAVDAGTRVARFMLQDSIGNFVPKFKEHSWRPGAWLCTAVMVGAWGAVLLMGVTDPLGGINTLFPLFGIANQLLAAIALSVCLAIVAKRGSFKYLWIVALPLAFAAVVTITASFQKIFSPARPWATSPTTRPSPRPWRTARRNSEPPRPWPPWKPWSATP